MIYLIITKEPTENVDMRLHELYGKNQFYRFAHNVWAVNCQCDAADLRYHLGLKDNEAKNKYLIVEFNKGHDGHCGQADVQLWEVMNLKEPESLLRKDLRINVEEEVK